MSVQSEITRLENAKASIKAAIEGKGVTVPDATLLDGMAQLIESIEAGGGDLTIDGRPVAWGILTPAEDITSTITLLGAAGSPWLKVGTMPTYNRKRITSGFIVRIPNTVNPSFATLVIGSCGPVYWNYGTDGVGGSVFYSKSSGSFTSSTDATLLELNSGALKLTPSTSYPLVAGNSYLWFAVQTVMPEETT